MAAGCALAGWGPLAVAGMLSPLRDHPAVPGFAAVVQLILVVGAATLAGRGAAVIATVTAMLSFDFLMIDPVAVLKLGDVGDLWPAGLILVGGLCAAAVAARSHHSSTAGGALSCPSLRIDRMARMVANRAGPLEVIAAAQAELGALLGAVECRFEADLRVLPACRLERNLRIVGATDHHGVTLPVTLAGRDLGGFILVGVSSDVPIERRLAAVVLADHVAVALARAASDTPSRPRHDGGDDGRRPVGSAPWPR